MSTMHPGAQRPKSSLAEKLRGLVEYVFASLRGAGGLRREKKDTSDPPRQKREQVPQDKPRNKPESR